MKQIIIYNYKEKLVIDINTKTFSKYIDGATVFNGSISWLFNGAVITNNFGKIVKTVNADQFFDLLHNHKSTLFYKNRKAKFLLRDIDHNTHRTWSKIYLGYEIHTKVTE